MTLLEEIARGKPRAISSFSPARGCSGPCEGPWSGLMQRRHPWCGHGWCSRLHGPTARRSEHTLGLHLGSCESSVGLGGLVPIQSLVQRVTGIDTGFVANCCEGMRALEAKLLSSSWISLWQDITRRPFLHPRACLMLNFWQLPSQCYWRAKASIIAIILKELLLARSKCQNYRLKPRGIQSEAKAGCSLIPRCCTNCAGHEANTKYSVKCGRPTISIIVHLATSTTSQPVLLSN
jgi:hypothetical protein